MVTFDDTVEKVIRGAAIAIPRETGATIIIIVIIAIHHFALPFAAETLRSRPTPEDNVRYRSLETPKVGGFPFIEVFNPRHGLDGPVPNEPLHFRQRLLPPRFVLDFVEAAFTDDRELRSRDGFIGSVTQSIDHLFLLPLLALMEPDTATLPKRGFPYICKVVRRHREKHVRRRVGELEKALWHRIRLFLVFLVFLVFFFFLVFLAYLGISKQLAYAVEDFHGQVLDVARDDGFRD
jgi:hypothetical protein